MEQKHLGLSTKFKIAKLIYLNSVVLAAFIAGVYIICVSDGNAAMISAGTPIVLFCIIYWTLESCWIFGIKYKGMDVKFLSRKKKDKENKNKNKKEDN